MLSIQRKMKVKEEDLKTIGLTQYPKRPHIWGDWEDLEYNNKSGDLYYHNCVDGSLELYRKVTDVEDLKQAIYDGFPNLRNELNLD